MNAYLSDIRACLWSDICHSDPVAYSRFLDLVRDAFFGVGSTGLRGRCCVCAGLDTGGCTSDGDLCSACAGCVLHGSLHALGGSRVVQELGSVAPISAGSGVECLGGELPAEISEHHGSVEGSRFDATCNDSDRIGSFGPVKDVGSGVNVRGPNFLRNQANRQAKKRRKQGRREEALRVDVQEKSGFWNSCSESVRRELIESKAKMHIAENLRKAKESEHRVSDMDSPFNLVQKVVKIVEFAQKQAEKTNDSRIHGWAQTVATVSAESLANSVPSSVPSLSEIKDSSPSCVSPDPSLVAKIEELELENNGLRKDGEDLRKVIQCLEDESLELRVEKEIADTQVSQISSRAKVTKKKIESKSGDIRTIENYANFPGLHLNKNLKFERFDPKVHTVMTRADVYREF